MAARLIAAPAAATELDGGAFVHDPASGRLAYCSTGFAALHGLDLERCRSLSADQRVTRWIHPDDQARYRAEVAAALRDARPYRVAYRLLREDGAVLQVEETAEVWDDPAAGGRRLVGSVGRVAVADERFFTAVEGLADGLAIYDADDRLVYFNHRYRALAAPGFRQAMAIGRRFDEIVGEAIEIDGLYHPDMGEALAAERLARRERSTEDREFRIADGRWLRVRENVLPDGGRVLLVHDTSERHGAMLQLEEREERLRAVADGIPMPLVIARLQQPEILFANGHAERIFGLRIGPQPDAIRRAYVGRDTRRRLIERLVADGEVEGFEAELRRADGSTMWAMLYARMIPVASELAVLIVVSDITERRAMEQALRESEARLAAFLQNAPIGMFLKDLEGRFLLANPEMGRFFGTGAAQMIGRTFADAPAGIEHGARVAALDAEVRATGRVLMTELATRRPDGTVWDLVIRFPIRDAAGEITAIAGFDVDITDRKAMEQALKASEQRFKAFAEAHPVPVVISRLDGRQIIFASPPFLRLFRTSLEDLAQGRLERFYERPEVRREVLDRVAAEGEVLGLEVRLRRADGEVFWGSFSSRLIEYEGAPAVVSSVIDITERKRVEQQLRESEQRFRVLAEAHPVPLMIVGVEDAIVMVASPACGAFFGVDTADLVGGSILSFYADPSDRAAIMDRIRREKRLSGYEVQMRRVDGSRFWAAFDSRLIEFGGKPAVVAAYVDLTEKKAAAAELERQREALMQSEKMSVLGSLLASVAHELNNPLSVVVGQATMLEELAGGTDMAERAGKIRAAADRCARIVRTFLAMARSKPPEFRDIGLNELVRSALELTAYGLRSAGVVVDLDLAEDLPPLSADGDQLHQVLTNLIINAKQAMQGCDVQRILHIRTGREDRHVVLEVADTGPGIPEEVREQIFNPFFTTKPAGAGTGIGLAVCRRIVQAHGGTIAIQGGDGEGARFRVRLPLRRTAAGPAAADEPAAPERPPAASALVIDDERDIADVLAEILRLDGFRVDTAHGGREALQRLEGRSYDLVISDLRMPDMDGPTLFRTVERTRPEVARRILFVTGDTLSPDAAEFVAAAGVPVIEKPFDARRIRRLAADRVARLRASAPAADG